MQSVSENVSYINSTCRVCGVNRKNKGYQLNDTIHGQEGEFTYFQCGKCDSLQILEIPGNYGFYQRHDSLGHARCRNHRNPIKRFRRKWQCKKILKGKKDFERLTEEMKLPERLVWFSEANITLNSRILDIFCGRGRLLTHMFRDGFENLTGTDSRLDKPIQYTNGITVFNNRLDQMTGLYDFIMVHHFLQRLHDQEAALKHIHRITADDGCVLVRMPLVDSYAWERYGTDWVQLNAPRNVIIHSKKSFDILCKKVGFEVLSVKYDSTEYQFYGSEQNRYGIPVKSPESWAQNPDESLFDQTTISDYRSRANELNRNLEGDQACFYLRKS